MNHFDVTLFTPYREEHKSDAYYERKGKQLLDGEQNHFSLEAFADLYPDSYRAAILGAWPTKYAAQYEAAQDDAITRAKVALAYVECLILIRSGVSHAR